jgi:hypothetical protein
MAPLILQRFFQLHASRPPGCDGLVSAFLTSQGVSEERLHHSW